MKFKPGDFICCKTDRGHFFIYEGDKVKESQYYTTFNYSVALEYDDRHYMKLGDGNWGYGKMLKLNGKDGILTVDYDCDNWRYDLMTDVEKEQALSKLEEFGYHWNDESKELCDTESGEIIFKIVMPSFDYNNELVRLMTSQRRLFLMMVCNKPLTTPAYNYNYEYYD